MNRYYVSLFLIVSLYSAVSSAQYHASASAPTTTSARIYSSPQPAGGPGTPTVSHHIVNGTGNASHAQKAQMALQAQYYHHPHHGDLAHSSSAAASSSSVSAATSSHPLTPIPPKPSAAGFQASHAHGAQVVDAMQKKTRRLTPLEGQVSNLQGQVFGLQGQVSGLQSAVNEIKNMLKNLTGTLAFLATSHNNSPHPSPLPSPAVTAHRAPAHSHHSHAAAPVHPQANPAHAASLGLPTRLKTGTPGGTPDLPTHPATPITSSGVSNPGSRTASPRSTATNATHAPLATPATAALLHHSINALTLSLIHI